MKYFTFLIAPIIFFIISLLTLYDYGMNWDSPIHFARGQAYLRYILTGKTSYDGEPKFCLNKNSLISRRDFQTGEVCDRYRKVRVSEYESPLLDFSWAVKDIYGHPAFSDIMLAASNTIFFKFFGIVEDIAAYHLYSLITTFLLAVVVAIWVKQTFGLFASIISVITIYSFPLLFSEQHFNIKDPPMAAFFTIALYFFWLAFVKKRASYLYISAFMGGASFATKLNFVFAPLILLPWVLIFITNFFKSKIKLQRTIFLALLLYPAVVFLVFFLSWPALWSDPIKNITEVFRYYRDIGGSSCSYSYLSPMWFSKCSQLTTIQYFLYTIPPTSLLLFAVGFIVSILKFKEKKYVTVLWLSFLSLTLLRVTFSISNIYGGLRQVMEFIAPMAMITGVGALFIRDQLVKVVIKISPIKISKTKVSILLSVILVSLYIPVFLNLMKLHPNQNVYFNSLIEGLSGAAKANISGFGNAYGNTYIQGIKWLNNHAEKDAVVSLIDGHGPNISRSSFREDINFNVSGLSGYKQSGEFMMLLINPEDQYKKTFRQRYAYNFLEPVYDLKIDEVSLLKIWKNEKGKLKNGINMEEAQEPIGINTTSSKVTLALNETSRLKRLEITFPSGECSDLMSEIQINISKDGKNYTPVIDKKDDFTETEISGYEADIVYFFLGDEAKYIDIISPNDKSCNLSYIQPVLYTFSNLYSDTIK